MLGALLIGVGMEVAALYLAPDYKQSVALPRAGDHHPVPPRRDHPLAVAQGCSAVIQYMISIATIGALGGILCLGLNVRWGWSGDFDLAYYAMVAVGAYMGGRHRASQGRPPRRRHLHPRAEPELPRRRAWWPWRRPPWPRCSSGRIALRRLRGDYLGITTVAFSLIITAVFTQELGLFNGFNGVYGPAARSSTSSTPSRTRPCSSIIFLVVAGGRVRACWSCSIAALGTGAAQRARGRDRRRRVRPQRLRRPSSPHMCSAGRWPGSAAFLFATYLTSWNPAGVEHHRGLSSLLGDLPRRLRPTSVASSSALVVVLVLVPEGTRYLPIGAPDTLTSSPRCAASSAACSSWLVLRFRPQGLIPERRPRDLRRRHRPLAARAPAAGSR